MKVFKDNKAKVFVSHHFNSIGSTDNILLMYHPKTLRDKDGNISSGASEKYFDNSQKLLECLKTELGKVFNDGRKIVPYAATYPNHRARSVGVLRDTDGSENASILIEHGEISNENVKFCKENSEAIGKAIATAIANYLGASKQDNGFYSECEDATSNSEAVTITEGSCQMCKSDHYNIAKSEHWLHQEPGECWAASVKVLKNYGISGGSSANRIIMANQTNTILTPTNTKEALDYIDSQLKINKPVVVGLDDNLRKTTYNSHKATDHFFVVVGKGCDNGKIYYRFFDVGAHTRESGTNESSKLHLQDNLLQGKSVGGTHNYTVTEVRRNN